VFDDVLKKYGYRQLDPQAGIKPLDFNHGNITGSVNTQGRLIAINTYDAHYGYITANATPPFTEEQRYDQGQVRAYRQQFVESQGYGLRLPCDVLEMQAYLIEDVIPYLTFTLVDDTHAACLTFAIEDGVCQIWRFSRQDIKLQITGNIWLQRAAYTQLTEGGPVDMPSAQTLPVSQGITNPALGWHLTMNTDIDSTPQADDSCHINGQYQGNCVLYWRLSQAESNHPAGDPLSILYTQLETWRAHWQHPQAPTDLIQRRAWAYSRACCVDIDADTTCILTDHMLLPLSWNRDAYYITMSLLPWQPESVKRHILWLFDRAQRVQNTWGRAYLANGIIKDHGYQLDQQIYPLLELADYTQHTQDFSLLDQFTPDVELILNNCQVSGMLLKTKETPADDPIALPYHLSSHILLWYTLRKLQKFDVFTSLDLSQWANELCIVINKYFIIDGLYAYAINDAGDYQHYHDANDIPFALAPAWGFVPADDAVWQATMTFAFSERNQGGYYDGRLGSVHTPGGWPLGDYQAWVLYDQAYEQLQHVAQWDGALPEAYDPQTLRPISRHWFAWPNALLTLRRTPSTTTR
jgi:uncharacterized protein